MGWATWDWGPWGWRRADLLPLNPTFVWPRFGKGSGKLCWGVFSFTYVPAPGYPLHILYRLQLSTSSLRSSGFHLARLPSLFIGGALDHDAMHCITHVVALYRIVRLMLFVLLVLFVYDGVCVGRQLSDTTRSRNEKATEIGFLFEMTRKRKCIYDDDEDDKK